MIHDHTVADIARGYAQQEDGFLCLVCGQYFEQGRIYSMGDAFYDAQGAAKKHVQDVHGGMTDYLLRQDAGLTEIQRRLLELVAAGMGDAQIAAELGIAQSTVRNHRFKLREKERQARMFLALMSAMERQNAAPAGQPDAADAAEMPAADRSMDEIYGITEEKRRKTIDTCFDKATGELKQIPAREKKKIIVLTEIMKNFKPGQPYSEAEVNRVLRRIYEPDYVSLRRYLIEYGFMDRSDDCRVYRVKE